MSDMNEHARRAARDALQERIRTMPGPSTTKARVLDLLDEATSCLNEDNRDGAVRRLSQALIVSWQANGITDTEVYRAIRGVLTASGDLA